MQKYCGTAKYDGTTTEVFLKQLWIAKVFMSFSSQWFNETEFNSIC